MKAKHHRDNLEWRKRHRARPRLGHNSLALEGDVLGCSALLQQPPKGEKKLEKA